MISQGTPLRYRIDNWHDLPQVLSNNSQDLYISVADIKDDSLSGTRITVNHDKYGVLFSEIVNAKGYLVSEYQDNIVYSLTDSQIFLELAKYGFLVEWSSAPHLSMDQITYLQILKGLHFDKLRLLNVIEWQDGLQLSNIYIVVFQANDLQAWLDNTYVADKKSFFDALNSGYALNITEVSKRKKYRWDWLNYVADIQDLLDAVLHGGDRLCGC